MRVAERNPTTCPSAWTPASVRPLASVTTASFVIRARISSMVPCTVRIPT
jgi:hypothetical protein